MKIIDQLHTQGALYRLGRSPATRGRVGSEAGLGVM